VCVCVRGGVEVQGEGKISRHEMAAVGCVCEWVKGVWRASQRPSCCLCVCVCVCV
jgi:hypothetical protein